MQDVQESEIICQRQGSAGVVTLNRPKALNALTLTMVRGLREALDAWENDPQITRVIVTGAGDRAFCAGGDIRSLYEQGRGGRLDEALTFWREEYQLNVRIREYSKPYIALVEGIVMGGGVGVSIHGSHMVAFDRFTFAMPEVGIGFFPDVGATFALPKLPGELGAYIAVTGDRLGQAEAHALGLVTHAAPSAEFGAIRERLIAGEPVDDVLAPYAARPTASALLDERVMIDEAFGAPDVPGVLARLDAAAAGGSGFAAKAAATMRTKSPTSMAIALEQMRRGRGVDMREAMRIEYRIVNRIALGQDFYEGVRAVIVDKDHSPKWSPAALDAVPAGDVAAYFAPLGDNELTFG